MPDAGGNNNHDDGSPYIQHALRPVLAVCLNKTLDGVFAELFAERVGEEILGHSGKLPFAPESLEVGLDRAAVLFAHCNVHRIEDEHQYCHSSVDSEEPRRVGHLIRGAKQTQCECGDEKRHPRDTGNNVRWHATQLPEYLALYIGPKYERHKHQRHGRRDDEHVDERGNGNSHSN